MAAWQDQLDTVRKKAGPLSTYQETSVAAPESPPAPGWGQQMDVARARAGAPFPDSQGYKTPAIGSDVSAMGVPDSFRTANREGGAVWGDLDHEDDPSMKAAIGQGIARLSALRTGANAPVYGSSGPRSALDVLDPMENVKGDIGAEWDRGMKNGGPAVAAGLAARETVVSPISRAMGAMSDVLKPIGRTIGDFGTAIFTGNTPDKAAVAGATVAPAQLRAPGSTRKRRPEPAACRRPRTESARPRRRRLELGRAAGDRQPACP
jgi:hypothetical protein